MASLYASVIGGTEDLKCAALTVNDAGADKDVRVETDTNADFFNIDGAALGGGCLSVGAAVPTNPQALAALLPPANATGVTANQSYYHATVLPGGATTIPTGTAPIVASLNVAEPNITATGTVTVAATVRIADAPTEGSSNYALWVDAGVSRFDGNIDHSSAALDYVVIANTAAALEFSDGTTKLLAFDTRNTVTGVVAAKFTSSAPTIAGASGTTYSQVGIAAVTITDSTQTTVDALDGICLHVGTPTINQSGGAVTVSVASSVYIKKPVAGASVTLSANYIINTDTAGCFLTAAGTWTDACTMAAKQNVDTADLDEVPELLDQVRSVRFDYKDDSDGHKRRFGVIAEEVPDFLAMPGRKGVAAMHVAAFALACAKYQKRENEELKRRLEQLEKKVKP